MNEEKLKELLYDLDRNRRDSSKLHKLILNYCKNFVSSNHHVRCIKNVDMIDGSGRAFTEGKTYRCFYNEHGFGAIDDMDKNHYMGSRDFFIENFEFI